MNTFNDEKIRKGYVFEFVIVSPFLLLFTSSYIVNFYSFIIEALDGFTVNLKRTADYNLSRRTKNGTQ